MSWQEVKAQFIEDKQRADHRWSKSPGASERKEEVSSLSRVWGVLSRLVVWCMCPPRHPGTGQNKDKIQVSISHLFLEARGLGVEIVQRQWLRYYPSCWKPPKISSVLCPLQGRRSLSHVWGGGAGPSKNKSRTRSKGEKKSFFFHGVPVVPPSPQYGNPAISSQPDSRGICKNVKQCHFSHHVLCGKCRLLFTSYGIHVNE